MRVEVIIYIYKLYQNNLIWVSLLFITKIMNLKDGGFIVLEQDQWSFKVLLYFIMSCFILELYKFFEQKIILIEGQFSLRQPEFFYFPFHQVWGYWFSSQTRQHSSTLIRKQQPEEVKKAESSFLQLFKMLGVEGSRGLEGRTSS